MIPQRAQGLTLVKAGREHRVVVIPVFARESEILRDTIAFRGGVHVVVMDGGRWHGPGDVARADRRQIVLAPHENRFAIARGNGFARGYPVHHVRPRPIGVDPFGVILPFRLGQGLDIELLRAELVIALMRARVGPGHQRALRHRLGPRHDVQRRDERCCRRAGVVDDALAIGVGKQQARLRHGLGPHHTCPQSASRRGQADLQCITSINHRVSPGARRRGKNGGKMPPEKVHPVSNRSEASSRRRAILPGPCGVMGKNPHRASSRRSLLYLTTPNTRLLLADVHDDKRPSNCDVACAPFRRNEFNPASSSRLS